VTEGPHQHKTLSCRGPRARAKRGQKGKRLTYRRITERAYEGAYHT
jgi:hypothetical protein